MSDEIAIVGMACRYPDARSPAELWENVLAKRQAFRRLPAARLRLEDYYSADRGTPDRTYARQAALIEGYRFDRLRFRVSGDAFRSADLAHWLALDVASEALADAGFPGGEGLPRETTAVLVGNTLTGEFSRANLMRLRWPYVHRVVEVALAAEGLAPHRRRRLLGKLEEDYKKPFPAPGQETLAGGLSNTIAGRICNHFDLKGGGYTIDAACAGSVLAVITACQSLRGEDVDVALAGGVDLSLDPFEMVGFAKAGALAVDEMRVYDARPTGFLPGEGGGFVVLMTLGRALAERRRVYAVIRGWGLSSDGGGGITRPEVEGQLLALRRAYRRAGFSADTVTYFEGHGTGTSAGDAAELRALTQARQEASLDSPPAVIGSVKVNIGHTKAAAGVAGLIKATLALHTQVLPPTSGCAQPHPFLSGDRPALQVLECGRLWPADRPLRAGVSAMGFGGINTHLVLESPAAKRRDVIGPREEALLRSSQDAELFLLSASSPPALADQVERLLALAPGLSRSELSDLAARLALKAGAGPVRLALVASTPESFASRLDLARGWLDDGASTRLGTVEAVFLARRAARPRLGFLFPGQGAPVYPGGGALGNRFPFGPAREGIPGGPREWTTAVAQPAIVSASLAALRVLNHLGLEADLAVGHSLGELTALHWAGSIPEESLVRIIRQRGAAMAEAPGGAMATVGAGRPEVEALLNGDPVVVACLNSPRQTVIAGERVAVASVLRRARERGLRTVELSVCGAFHSPLVASAVPTLGLALAREPFRPPQRTVLSTVTGAALEPGADLRQLLCRQLTSPVRFAEAVASAGKVDLWVEAGPGRILSGLLAELSHAPAIPLDVGGPSVAGLLAAVGAAFVLGAPVKHRALFDDRFHRPFDLDHRPEFFQSPCEPAPASAAEPEEGDAAPPPVAPEGPATSPLPASDSAASSSALDLVRQLIAERAELPSATIEENERLLKDLHLNSIAVGQLVVEAARRLGLSPPASLTDYADATVGEVARALEERARLDGPAAEEERFPAGVDSWLRAFTVELKESPLPPPRPLPGAGTWEVFAPPDHALGESLGRLFRSRGEGAGVVVCLPPEPDEPSVGLLLAGARAALGREGPAHFVVVQHGGGGAALARTLHLEARSLTTCVVDVPAGCPETPAWVLAEVRSAAGYVEAHYDAGGRRSEPVLRLLPDRPAAVTPPLEEQDVILVTGGGKGITAECALALARQTGARLAVAGRARPETDAELAANLGRMSAAGVRWRYLPSDVSDAGAMRALVDEVDRTLGPVTAVLHGAAVNVPCLLSSLDEGAFRNALGPKVQGLRNVLAVVRPERLRLLVTFGSLLARSGMRGEAHYAVANEWLTRLTECWQAKHPYCRCLAVEWSIWSGAGMGQRMGALDTLMRTGITPIPLDWGVRALSRLLAQKTTPVAVAVTGRFGEFPTLKLEGPQLPLRRFLERPRVYYPGVELVAEADLSRDADPYLDDHVFRGDRLFPAALGLEAMAQAAQVLINSEGLPVLEHIQFSHPVVVPADGCVTIRLAALRRESGAVDVALRSSGTGFQMDHFRAVCRAPGLGPDASTTSWVALEGGAESDILPLDPEQDLYGKLLFQGERFRRLRAFRRLQARECCAEVLCQERVDWFSLYLPPHLVLGDPGVRDAAMHAIQSCIPHVTLLPLGLERVTLGDVLPPGLRLVHARERSCKGGTFVYDVEIVGPQGQLLERWEGLRLRVVAEGPPLRNGWPAALFGPYLERRFHELSPGSDIAVVLEAVAGREERGSRALRRLLGSPTSVYRRPDGKPVTAGDRIGISAAHTADLTLAVAGTGSQGCDLEQVVNRPEALWRDLLGPEGYRLAALIARKSGEDEATAGTRVWAARECLKKAGAAADTPLTFDGAAGAGWVTLASGRSLVATLLAHVRDVPAPVVIAALLRRGHAGL
jgi:enediyne polyketide synthase